MLINKITQPLVGADTALSKFKMDTGAPASQGIRYCCNSEPPWGNDPPRNGRPQQCERPATDPDACMGADDGRGSAVIPVLALHSK